MSSFRRTGNATHGWSSIAGPTVSLGRSWWPRGATAYIASGAMFEDRELGKTQLGSRTATGNFAMLNMGLTWFIVMKILPANSEGCWLFIFVIVLSFFVIWFLHFFVIPVLWCHVFVIFLSPPVVSCRFLLSSIVHFLSVFSSGSGKRWRWQTRSRKCQKKCKKWLPVWEMQKKMQKKWLPVWEMQKKCQKNDS